MEALKEVIVGILADIRADATTVLNTDTPAIRDTPATRELVTQLRTNHGRIAALLPKLGRTGLADECQGVLDLLKAALAKMGVQL